MATVPVSLKHAGKKYDVELDTSQTGLWLKTKAYELTGVPTDKVKIVVKGGMLKVRERRGIHCNCRLTARCTG
jgi:ubiquitin carboxyl-terminal hydrolase 14